MIACDFDVESLLSHMRINLLTSVPLGIFNTCSMLLKYVQNQLFNRLLLLFEIHVKFLFDVLILVVVMEMRSEFCL